MKINSKLIVSGFCLALACGVALAGERPIATGDGVRSGTPKSRILFSFDTEDYTCDRSNDAIRDIAHLLTEEGVRGNFNIVGYLAGRLVELRRFDVIEALKPHVIGSQTLYHSRHPDIAELGDDPDYARAFRRTQAEEARAFGMLEAVFGEGRCVFWCPPGNSVSAVAMDVYSDLGVPFSAGCGVPNVRQGSLYSGMLIRPGRQIGGLWYFNQYHAPYSNNCHLESFLPVEGRPGPDVKAMLDRLAQYDLICVYMHPHMALKLKHWDSVNYFKENQVPWRQWNQVPDRSPEDTALYYRRLRDFVRAMKADARFEITDFEALRKSLKPRRAIGAKDVPAIRAALLKSFGAIHEPASWSVADAFQAAVRLLRGETRYEPSKVYGFLTRPQGVRTSVRIAADDLRAAAKRIDLSTFLPPAFEVGGVRIGPADFLMAALEVLETGAASVTVTPRDQLGSFAACPGLETMNISGKWVHTPAFEDRHLSEYLRLQLWTLRIE